VKISCKLTQSDNYIKKLMAEALRDELNRIVGTVGTFIEANVRLLFYDYITNSEEWTSLKSGKLRAQFGLPDDVEERLVKILGVWLASVKVTTAPILASNGKISGKIILNMIQANWRDVDYSLGEAFITTKKGKNLPWLAWLLTAGDKRIIVDYKAVEGDFSRTAASRSHMGLMFKKEGVYSWGVPPEYAGTESDNFVTKILDKIGDDILDLMVNELIRQLR